MFLPLPSAARVLACLTAFVLATFAATASGYARMCTSADTLVFGDRAVGSSTLRAAVITSCGDEAFHFTGVSVHPATAAAFRIDTGCASGGTLAPGASCTVNVTFSPTSPGQVSGAVWLHNDTSTPDQLVTFYARGTDAQAGVAAVAFAPATLDFGNVALGTAAGPRVLAVRNVGSAPLVPSAMVVNGPGAYDYSTQASGAADDCGLGVAIPPGGECRLNVYFQPQAAGVRAAQLNFDAPQLASLALAGITGAGVVRASVATLEVIEFAHAASGQYFLATDAAETAMLDAGGPGGGWQRTGMRFTAWPAAGSEPADAQPVCRFFGTPGVGPNSHFFTANGTECAAVRGDPRWIDEGIAFRARLPVDGACAAHDAPLLRLWRAGADATASRHRYVANAALVPAMQADGWTLEGAVMCVAGATQG